MWDGSAIIYYGACLSLDTLRGAAREPKIVTRWDHCMESRAEQSREQSRWPGKSLTGTAPNST